jgi:putative DNA primase/helicase
MSGAALDFEQALALQAGATVHHLHDNLEAPTPLPSGLPPVAQFDDALLPETLRGWIGDISERMQCPPDYVAVAAICAAGSIIGRQVGICPQSQTDWIEYPTMWGCVIGRPGAMKSPALKAALAPMTRLQAQARDEHKVAVSSFEAQAAVQKLKVDAAKSSAKKALKEDARSDVSTLLAMISADGDAPALKRYTCNDTSAESLGELLRQNPNGLLVFRDELVTLLRWLDDEQNSTARGLYLQGWDAKGDYTFDRIGRGLDLHVPHVAISLLGSTQPGKIGEYLRTAIRGGAGDDGLLQRFGLFVWPDQQPEWRDVDRWPDKGERERAHDVYERLAGLSPSLIGAQHDVNDSDRAFLRFAPDALGEFRDWRTDLERRLRSNELHPALESHLAKYRKLVPTLALVNHLADNSAGDVILPHVLRAIGWAEYLETHAARAYQSITDGQAIAARAIWRKVAAQDLPTSFTLRDIHQRAWSGLTDRPVVQDGLDMLVDYGWLNCAEVQTGGRPALRYTANPRGLA